MTKKNVQNNQRGAEEEQERLDGKLVIRSRRKDVSVGEIQVRKFPDCVKPTELSCRTLKELANGKAAGADEIPIQLFKGVSEEAIKLLSAVCTQIWSRIVWSKRWKQSVSILFPKKGDARKCQISEPFP